MITDLKLIQTLAQDRKAYFAGGPVRDWLLGKWVKDIDLVLESDAMDIAKGFASQLGGSFIPLDTEHGVARVVFKGLNFDFSDFRGENPTINEDLACRDFTINAMAVPIDIIPRLSYSADKGLWISKAEILSLVIDPFFGLEHLEKGLIRAVEMENLVKDPLRLLRAFRFKATLNFKIETSTLESIEKNAPLITAVAPERISHELECILDSPRAGHTFSYMYKHKLLSHIIPETNLLEGVEQPGFHHLDVLGHAFETLSCMDRLIMDPCHYFKHCCKPLEVWITQNKPALAWLKWAAFLHDFGKPAKKDLRSDGRVTFYEHDKEGAKIARTVAKRLKWSKKQEQFIVNMIRLHMRPFHLLNDLKNSGPTKRAMRRLLEQTGADYPALFLLAMSDTLAGCGPLKPKDLEDQLSRLFEKIHSFYLKNLEPVEKSPPLLRGNDVMEILGIGPGPVVGQALKEVKKALVEGRISNKQEAISLIKKEFASKAPS